MTSFNLPSVGEILKDEFLNPLGLSQNALAIAIGVPSNRINNIVNGKTGITADTDLRLTTYFGLSEGYFMRLQNSIQITQAKRSGLSKQLAQIIPFCEIQKKKHLDQDLIQA